MTVPGSNASLRRRLAGGVSGQAFSRVVNALYTVALVPILIRAWGLTGYGEWMALTAISSYFGLSNFGLVTTSANEIVMAIGAGDDARARRTFQMAVNLVLYIVLPLLAVIVALVAAVPLARILNFTTISQQEAVWIVVCCATQLWLQTLRGVVVAALYATGAYGFAYFLSGLTKLLELAAVAAIAGVLHGPQTSAATAIACVAVIDCAIILGFARAAAPWATFDFRVWDTAWLKSQIKPAIGFVISNLSSQGMIVQGPRVVLSAVAGGAAVGIYAVYGTAMRLVDQLLLMVALPLEVEIARNVGNGDMSRAYRLIVGGSQFGWIVFFAVALALLGAGPFIFHLWTHGRVAYSYILMASFLAMSAGNQVGRISAHALISSNKMYGPSIVALLGCAAALATGGALAARFGLEGMAAGVIAGELFFSLVAVVAVSRWFKRPVGDFFYQVLNWNAAFAELRLQLDWIAARARARSRSV